MTRQRRASGALSGLALIAFPLIAGGCGSIFETNQAACRRVLAHITTCGSPSDAPPELGILISQVCAPVPETSDCDDWPAYADCVTAIPCTEMLPPGPHPGVACDDIQAGLENNGCFPGGV